MRPRTPPPRTPIDAVIHPDPYPYYATLVAERPLYHDPELGLWVASGAAVVDALLHDPRLKVRPPGVPVPMPIAQSAAGAIFRELARMNDGPRHAALKPVVAATVDGADLGIVVDEVARIARRLMNGRPPGADPGRVASALPVMVVARLLGAPDERLRGIADAVAAFVGCLPAHPTTEAIEAANGGASHLLGLFNALISESASGLLAGLARHAAGAGVEPSAVVANAIGLLSQTCEATAGLIGNTLVTLSRHPDLAERIPREPPSFARSVVAEVARYDPSIQNTRRFVGEDGVVAGVRMAAGDTVLLVLAAANRDPALNPDPDRFLPDRSERAVLSFGAGAHRCPGGALAETIAAEAARALLQAGFDLRDGPIPSHYLTSANARIPVFGAVSRADTADHHHDHGDAARRTP